MPIVVEDRSSHGIWTVEAVGTDGGRPVLVCACGSRRLVLNGRAAMRFELPTHSYVGQILQGRLLVVGPEYGGVAVYTSEGELTEVRQRAVQSARMFGTPLPHREGLAWPASLGDARGWWVESLLGESGFLPCLGLPEEVSRSEVVGIDDEVLAYDDGVGELVLVRFPRTENPLVERVTAEGVPSIFAMSAYVEYVAPILTIHMRYHGHWRSFSTDRWNSDVPASLRVHPTTSVQRIVIETNMGVFLAGVYRDDLTIRKAPEVEALLSRNARAIPFGESQIVLVGPQVAILEDEDDPT